MRVAVVGAGGWGEHHARIFSRRADTELCAVVGRTPEKTRHRAEKYDTTPYTDLDLMMAVRILESDLLLRSSAPLGQDRSLLLKG